MTQWQPIDTAPKDGTVIRLRSLSFRPYEAFFWNEKTDRWETRICAVMGMQTGWWAEDAEQPTHWMPLPEPPDARP